MHDCQCGHLCAELISECVSATTWKGCTSLLGVISAEPPVYTAWLPWVTADKAEGREGEKEDASSPVAPPGTWSLLLHHNSGCTKWPFTEPKCRGKAHF